MKRENEEDPVGPKRERRPYSPPRIEESGKFEHLTLTCTFQDEGTLMCGLGQGMPQSMS